MRKLLLPLAVVLILLFSCDKGEKTDSDPVVGEASVSEITDSTAKVTFRVEHGDTDIRKYLCYSADEEPDFDGDKVEGVQDFLLSDLAPETRYYIRGCAVAGGKSFYGPKTSFVTLAKSSGTVGITVKGLAASEMTGTAAVISYSVYGDDIKTVGVCWASEGDPTVEGDHADGNFVASGQPVSTEIEGLNAAASYRLRVYAFFNDGSVGYSDEWIAVYDPGYSPEFEVKEMVPVEAGTEISYRLDTGAGWTVVKRGVCWDREDVPDTDDEKTEDEAKAGELRTEIKGLEAGASYKARPYALLAPAGDESAAITAYGDLFEVRSLWDDNYCYIPDERFREIILKMCDSDGDGMVSRAEAEQVQDFGENLVREGIVSLEGIEYFVNLRELNCSENSIENLDLNRNHKLERLECGSNSMKSLNVGGCPLRYLDCSANLLKQLDLSGLTELETLRCESNVLAAIGLEDCTKLKELFASWNKLISLDLSGYTALETVEIIANGTVASLDFSGCGSLKTVLCNNNSPSLKWLDLEGCGELVTVNCEMSSLKSINVRGCPNLTFLRCIENELEELDLSSQTKLEVLQCGINYITRLVIGGGSELRELDVEFNELTELDLAGYVSLVTLYAGNNFIEELDVSECTKLKLLHCAENPIAKLDLSGLAALEDFDCSLCGLDELVLSGNLGLKDLYCSYNNIAELDVSECKELTTLYCAKNRLTRLDLSQNIYLESLMCMLNDITVLDLSNNPLVSELECDPDVEIIRP